MSAIINLTAPVAAASPGLVEADAPVPGVEPLMALVSLADHPRVGNLAAWLADGGDCRHGIDVELRDGQRALLLGERGGDELVFSVVPLSPDPVAIALDLMIGRRSLDAVLQAVVGAYGQLGVPVWATVHYDADADRRLRSVVAATGLDTFRRAIEAAVHGDASCVWDRDPDDARTYRLSEVGDGIALAGRHAGIGACAVTVLDDDDGGAAGALVLWCETAALLDHPTVNTLHERVVQLVEIAFAQDQAQRAARWMQDHDALTGALNRRAFFSELRSPAAQRHCAVACIDVDGFAEVNRTQGSAGGDILLVEVAQRLREIMRPGDRVARVSSDRFAVLYTELRTGEVVAAIASRLHALFDAPVQLSGGSASVSVSVGMAGSATDLVGARLFDCAERTMLDVKADDPGAWRVAEVR